MLLITFLSSIIDGFCLYLFITKFLDSKNESSFKYLKYLKIATYAILELGIYINPFLEITNQQLNIILVSAYSFLITFLFTIIYKGSISKKIFTAFSFNLLAGFSENATIFIVSKFNPDLYDYESEYNTQLLLLISKLILFIIVLCVRYLYKNQTSKAGTTYNIFVFITPLISLLILCLSPVEILTNTNSAFTYLLVMFCIIVTNILNYIMLENIKKKELYTFEIQNLKLNISMQDQKYKQLADAYRSTRKLVHDTKKQLLTINGYAERNECGKIIEYTENSIEKLTNTYVIVNTGNLVIDTFLCNYSNIAKLENITFDIKLDLNIDDIPLTDYDFSIILGNLLDNCFDAVLKINKSENRNISILLKSSDHHFILKTTNPYVASEVLKEDLQHGYGISNIKNIVDNYSGTYSFSKNNLYEAKIAIPIFRDSNGKRISYYINNKQMEADNED